MLMPIILVKMIDINIIVAIYWPPPLISHLLANWGPHPFSQLGCFALEKLLIKIARPLNSHSQTMRLKGLGLFSWTGTILCSS